MSTHARSNAVEPVAELRGVTKRYGAVAALDRVDLALAPGEVTALLGPNGAGKTTTVRLMLGLVKPSAGTALLFGGDPLAAKNRRRTGVMLQVSKVPETLKVVEHIHLFSSYYPNPMSIDEVVEIAGLTGIENRKFGELSGGQRQRVLFALAICGNPSLLFLDEPTVGLDVESRRSFWAQIRGLAGRGCSILLTTHYLEEADALADRVVVIANGSIIADGTSAEIKARAAGKQVRCRTRLSGAELASLPGVKSVRRDGDVTFMLTGEPERAVRELHARDAALSDLEITGAKLEEAFLALTSAETPASNIQEVTR
jgi:ABC-2 type transport system ATP-binding protein